MKPFWHLVAFALAVLAPAAVWLGGLNQDEGWYLYAANLVAQGNMPYRDFFFTQAPLMPLVYSALRGFWMEWGILGGRVVTLAFGLTGIVLFTAFARRLAGSEKRGLAALLAAMMLCGNLYHLYYLAIPKTYALASLFVATGFYLLSFEGAAFAFAAGLSLAFSAATRMSLGVMLPVVGLGLLMPRAREGRGRLDWLFFGLGGALGLAVSFGPFLTAQCLPGFLASQFYHAGRAGFNMVFAVGSISRLVRWYLPVVVLSGLGVYACVSGKCGCASGASGRGRTVLRLAVVCFAAAFAVHMLAPVPYEDYQVPVMGLLAAVAAVVCAERLDARPAAVALAVLGMTCAGSFGSPLLQQWSTGGQDRLWPVVREKSELAQLREVAREIKALDPDGKDILTQDLYLAIETGRDVPRQLAMGPFSLWERLPYRGAEKVLLDADGMKRLLDSAPCGIAAMSGYSFAITAPRCEKTPMNVQLGFWNILKQNYDLVFTEERFGQGSTPLMVLKRKDSDSGGGEGPVQ